MKFLAFFFFFVLFNCSCSSNDFEEQDLKESIPVHSFKQLVYCDTLPPLAKKITKWMNYGDSHFSRQGADVYNGHCFFLGVNHTVLEVLDIEKKEIISNVALDALNSSFHCNNVDFSSFFYSVDDEYPLLYSSHQGRAARCILVERIRKEAGSYSLSLIQTIFLPIGEEKPLQYTPDAIVDKDNGFLYVYTGNTRPITDMFIYKFRLPQIQEGEVVELSMTDLLDCWTITGNPAYYKQGGTIKDDVLYLVEGVPGWNSDNILRIIDFKKNVYKLVNLTDLFNSTWEPEDVFFYENKLFVTSAGSGIFCIETDSLL